MKHTARPRSLAAVAALVLASSAAAPALAGPPEHAGQKGPKPAFEFGVIGDVPYGAEQIAAFPGMISELNQQDELEFLVHVGDIKAGSDQCTDEYFSMIRTQFDRLTLPLVYTPGDNEWVDCHRVNNGAYNPLERLDALREVFFPAAGRTLGDTTMRLDSQMEQGLPENVRFREQRVEFGVVNIQGSENSTKPWNGIGETEATAEQLAEVAHRDAANQQLIREMFADARQKNARGVVIMTQADMFDPWNLEDGVVADPSVVDAFRETVALIAEESRSFDGPVYLINGDSHNYNADKPLAAGSPWLDAYGLEPVENLQRITVEGAAKSNEWTRFTVAPNSAGKGRHADQPVLTWERVPYTN